MTGTLNYLGLASPGGTGAKSSVSLGAVVRSGLAGAAVGIAVAAVTAFVAGPAVADHMEGHDIDPPGLANSLETCLDELEAGFLPLSPFCRSRFDDIVDSLQPSGPSVFVTSGTFTGALGGITGADSKCQEAAGTALPDPLPGSWIAWISDMGTDAGERIDGTFILTAITPFELPDGTIVADTIEDLLNTFSTPLLAPINIDESGLLVGSPFSVWTGTRHTGRSSNRPGSGSSAGVVVQCGRLDPLDEFICAVSGCDWEIGASVVVGIGLGDVDAFDREWTNIVGEFGRSSATCDELHRLYCFRVTVLEP